MWNGIIGHLRSRVTESDGTTISSRLRKQHSRFVTGGMLLIRPNPTELDSHVKQQSFEACFSGSQCVDIVYQYLVDNKSALNFEKQVTRDKCVKLCQLIMDSGVFEPVSRSTTKFDDSLLKYYRLIRSEHSTTQTETHKDKPIQSSSISTAKIDLCDDDDNYNKKSNESNKENSHQSKSHSNEKTSPKNVLQSKSNENEAITTTPQRQNNQGLIFSKSGFLNRTAQVNTKLKRKLVSMKRSSTVHSLLPDDNATNDEEPLSSIAKTPIELTTSPKLTVDEANSKPPISKLARTKSIGHSDIKSGKYSENKLAQDLLVTRQITRELIIEKLLSLIDLPIIEHLLMIDQKNDAEYCEILERYETVVFNSNRNQVSANSDSDQMRTNVISKSSMNYLQRSLSILNLSYDMNRVDMKDEWRKSALECLEFLDWERFCGSENDHLLPSETDKTVKLVFLKDIELYGILRDLYSHRHKSGLFFMDESFQPLFSNIIGFIKKNLYSKALEILNLGTLLLLKQTQAELKRLLKFLYLTAVSTHAPRLSDLKPNNSIILNHFAVCLLNPKTMPFEETRLLLNFMLNNFDDLFKLNKSIEDSIRKRKLMMQRYGQEEALLEKVYCKRQSNEEFEETSREHTSKALVELINHIIDDPHISLKQKKLKLKALQRIHPDIYEKHFSDFF